MPLMPRRQLLLVGAALAAAPSAFAAGPELEVWKMRGCACCEAWADRFMAAGFAARLHEVDDLDPIRAAAGVPADLGGCHTARIEGFVVEGHVPVEAVQRLLAERPMIAGIAVPGMPIGSPGMEVPGRPGEPYDVIAFAGDATRAVFMSVRP